MIVSVILVICVITLIFGSLYRKYIYRRWREGEPPIVPGHVILGSSKEFHNNAVQFLQDTRKKMGDIFTIRLMAYNMTMIMDPHSVSAFSKERRFDFDPIQKQVNYNVFGFILKDPRTLIKESGRSLRGESLKFNLLNFDKHLAQSINILFNTPGALNDPSNEITYTRSLRDITSETLFYSIFLTVFGKDAEKQFKPLDVHSNFDTFHHYFIYLWLGFPLKLFPKAQKALEFLVKQVPTDELLKHKDLCEYLRLSIGLLRDKGQSESDIIGHSLVFLHVNYNTFRLSYWCIYHLMAYPDACKAIRDELNDIIQDKMKEPQFEKDNCALFTINEIESLPVLDSFVNETMRLTNGAFMVRCVTEDCQFTMDDGKSYSLRCGDRVAFYPPALHKDPDVFDKPLEFKYDRFIDNEFYENGRVLKSPVMGFGTICPGKRLAMIEAKWYILVMIHRSCFWLSEGERTQCDVNHHGNEILPPVRDVTVHIRPTHNPVNIRLV